MSETIENVTGQTGGDNENVELQPGTRQSDAATDEGTNGDRGDETDDEDEGTETDELVERNAEIRGRYAPGETFELTLTLPKVMQANVRGRKVLRDMTKLPVRAHDHLYGYGFQRVNNDAGAISREKDPKTKQYTESLEAFEIRAANESLAQSDKKWEALVAGTIRVQSTRETDPVMVRAMEMAVANVTAAFRTALGLDDDAKLPKEIDNKMIKDKARTVVESDPDYLESAKRQIEEAKKVKKEIKIDLAGLFPKADEPKADEPKGDETPTETKGDETPQADQPTS